MSLQEIDAKVTKGERAGQVFTAKVEIPDSIDEALALERSGAWPTGAVYSRFAASLIIDVQSAMRTAIGKDGATAELVQAAVGDWKPGVKAKGKTVVEKLQDMMGKLTEEERRALLEEFLA
jgi:hypothetical protein